MHGYIEGLKRMLDYVILKPQASSQALALDAHLRALNIRKLPPDPVALEHNYGLG